MKITIFQSTPSARRATEGNETLYRHHIISIHALREEGDRASRRHGQSLRDFNPRPPRGGRLWPHTVRHTHHHFNPRPPRGGRQLSTNFPSYQFLISIHALREEGDLTMMPAMTRPPKFQSTPSARRATRPVSYDRCALDDFNPRPPRGGRQQKRRKIRHVCSIIHTCAQFEKELYEGSGEMQNKSC